MSNQNSKKPTVYDLKIFRYIDHDKKQCYRINSHLIQTHDPIGDCAIVYKHSSGVFTVNPLFIKEYMCGITDSLIIDAIKLAETNEANGGEVQLFPGK